MKMILTIAACLIVSAATYGQDASKPAEAPGNMQAPPSLYAIKKPEVIHSVEALSSDAAKRDHLSGTVLVGLIVDAQGNPQNVHILKSVRQDLDDSAINAVKQYKFKPATKHGTPIAVQLSLYVSFKN